VTQMPAQRTSGVNPLVISVVGELDMSRESEIVNLVMTPDPAPGTTVHVDMSEVTFVDSAGLNALLKTKAYLQGRQCVLRLLNPQDQFLRVVDLVGLKESLPVDLTDGERRRATREVANGRGMRRSIGPA
jgi:anti-sigma B factor antagonist